MPAPAESGWSTHCLLLRSSEFEGVGQPHQHARVLGAHREHRLPGGIAEAERARGAARKRGPLDRADVAAVLAWGAIANVRRTRRNCATPAAQKASSTETRADGASFRRRMIAGLARMRMELIGEPNIDPEQWRCRNCGLAFDVLRWSTLAQ